MKKSEVKIGEVYRVKVSGTIADVRITGESPYGGWDGVNVATKRKVRIKSAQRLRGLATKKVATDKTTSATGAKKGSRATKDATSATERDTGERGATGGEPVRTAGGPDAKKMSLLDAAAHLLSLATGEAMRCKDIVDQVVARGLWAPGEGKTPDRTLYAAILREIQKKGDKARFRKAERGKFTLAK